tara:strand:+ start:1015 stop:1431 length:417 start_codon:yes stop_codon:yes gene_type:complete
MGNIIYHKRDDTQNLAYFSEPRAEDSIIHYDSLNATQQLMYNQHPLGYFITRRLFTKDISWEHEVEFRIITHLPPRFINIDEFKASTEDKPQFRISKIIVGMKVDNSIKKLMHSSFSDHLLYTTKLKAFFREIEITEL